MDRSPILVAFVCHCFTSKVIGAVKNSLVHFVSRDITYGDSVIFYKPELTEITTTAETIANIITFTNSKITKLGEAIEKTSKLLLEHEYSKKYIFILTDTVLKDSKQLQKSITSGSGINFVVCDFSKKNHFEKLKGVVRWEADAFEKELSRWIKEI